MNRTISPFKDILHERRNECSNFMWVSRKLNPMLPYKRDPMPTPKQHKLDVLHSAKIQELIETLSREQNVSVKELEQRVRMILDEIGFNKQTTVIRWLGLFLAKVCCKVCNGIYVNEDSVRKLKSQMGKTPIIYVPSHRSYADFILMSYILFTLDLEIPAIAAGMDFHGMKGMGTVLRNTGAFFMRRSYNDDSLYWDTFREYVKQLVTRGSAGIEFFIEGTRSRSNKSLSPKFGLLTMILRAFITSEIHDILFVPINISYDRVMEERLFAFELLGIPKPKESTSGFFKSLSLVKENYGNIYVDFGSPISVKDFFGDRIDRSKHAMQPLHMQSLSSSEKNQISLFAEHVVHCQQKLSVISAFNLIAVILTNNLIMKKSIMRLDELVIEAMWLRKALQTCGALTNLQYPRKGVEAALRVHSNLVDVDEDSNVTLVQNVVVLGAIDAAKLKGHNLSHETISIAVPFVMLQIYVNPTLHYVINHAILISILRSHTVITKDVLLKEFTFLRLLFSSEFVLFDYNLKKDFETSIQQLLELDAIVQMNETDYSLSKNEKLQTLLNNLLVPFIFCYYIVCNILNDLEVASCSEKAILEASQEKLESIINSKDDFVHPYTLSLDTITICLQSLVKLHALSQTRTNEKILYNINRSILFGILETMEKYIPNHRYQRKAATIGLKNKL